MTVLCVECLTEFKASTIITDIKCPIKYCHGMVREIDDEIVPHIKLLVTKGYVTEYSCAGHINSKGNIYIMINMTRTFNIHQVHSSNFNIFDLSKDLDEQFREIKISEYKPHSVGKFIQHYLKYKKQVSDDIQLVPSILNSEVRFIIEYPKRNKITKANVLDLTKANFEYQYDLMFKARTRLAHFIMSLPDLTK